MPKKSGRNSKKASVINNRRQYFRSGHRKAAYEWWYAHGYLTDESDHHYGFMFSFFRFNKRVVAGFFPEFKIYPGRTIYQLHQGYTDITAQRHYFDEQSFLPTPGRATFGRRKKLAVFGPNHFYRLTGRHHDRPSGRDRNRPTNRGQDRLTARGQARFELLLRHTGRQIHLHLADQKGLIPHGQKGVIKIAGQGSTNYYSYPRLKVEGSLTALDTDPTNIHGPKRGGALSRLTGHHLTSRRLIHHRPNGSYNNQEQHFVHGSAWIDHQWGDFLTHQPMLFWTWIAIQLNNNQEIMIFEFYDATGHVQKRSATFVDQRGHATHPRVLIKPLTNWTSSKTKTAYPVDYLITIPKNRLRLHLTADALNQEMPSRWFGYWEGSCSVTGTLDRQAVTGKAYLEQTGLDRTTKAGLKKRLA